jgi:site-specific recombinase XerD
METIPTLDAIDQYQQYLYGRGLLPDTIKGYSTDVKMFFVESSLTSCSLTDWPALVAKWMNQAKSNRVAAKTVRRRATSIKSFNKFLGLPPILVDYNMPPLEEHVPHPLPGLKSDLEKLSDRCRTEEQSALIGFLGYEGLRLFEALGVSPADIDVASMMLTVWGKRGKKRVIPITPSAWIHISPAYLTALVYNNPRVVNYSDRGARNYITELGGKVGISRPISSHDLRATFATLSYAEHKDIEALRIWLGHDSIETTQMYVSIAIETLRKAGEF